MRHVLGKMIRLVVDRMLATSTEYNIEPRATLSSNWLLKFNNRTRLF